MRNSRVKALKKAARKAVSELIGVATSYQKAPFLLLAPCERRACQVAKRYYSKRHER